MNELVWTER